ncbi:hypothetical protein [Caldanaerobacter subterraneus]|nr:hypothetical protein [Caldanaerobacter subterraneus]
MRLVKNFVSERSSVTGKVVEYHKWSFYDERMRFLQFFIEIC